MTTSDATDNIQNISSSPSPDTVSSGEPVAGGDTPRLFSRQVLTGNARGIQQFGTPNLFADAGNNYFGVAKNSINQVLMGLQPTFGEGFYVTKPGIDVTKATNAEDFIFNSNQNIYKIIDKDTASITGPAELTTIETIEHGLGFTPIIQGYLNGTSLSSGQTGLSLPLPTWTSVTIDTIKATATNSGNPLPIVSFGAYLSIAADSQLVYILLFNALSNPVTYTVTYYLLQETAN